MLADCVSSIHSLPSFNVLPESLIRRKRRVKKGRAENKMKSSRNWEVTVWFSFQPRKTTETLRKTNKNEYKQTLNLLLSLSNNIKG